MKRTNRPLHIPDVINKSTTKNFTQLPNELLRNPELSFKAKGILALLLSNRDGWTSYQETLIALGTEGKTAIQSGLQELEQHKYLIRVRYRDIEKKKVRGSFWIYTDVAGQFVDLQSTVSMLRLQGMQADWPEFLKAENLKAENLDLENLDLENQRLIILNNNNTNNNNTNSSTFGKDESTEEADSTETDENKKPTLKERNKKLLPLAKYLSKIVKSQKNISHSTSQLNSWANDIRLLVEQNKVHPKRIQKALRWYKDNAGRMYVPVIESGSSLRNKFVKLEDAIKRDNSPAPKKKNNPATGYQEEDIDYGEPDMII